MVKRISICDVLVITAPVLLLAAFPAWAQNSIVTLLPGANVQLAVDANPENTTFIFRPGIYRLQSIQPKNGDSFVGQYGAVLNGAQLLTAFTRQGNLWVASGQTQQGQQHGVCDSQHPTCGYPEDLFFDSLPLLHVGSLSEVVPGSWYFDYPNHNIYLADDPSGRLVEASVSPSAFSGPANNVNITGLTVEKYSNPAQHGAVGDQPGSNWIVTNNEIRWNHGCGMGLSDGSQAKLNFVHHNGQLGIGAVGKNILVEGNQVSFNNWAGFDPTWEAGGMKASESSNLIVRGNSVHDNFGPGLWTDIDSINTLYESNIVMNNSNGAGIAHEISYAAVIRYNIVANNSLRQSSWLWGAQIMIQNSQNVQVYGNTVDVPAATTGGSNGIAIIQQNRGTGAYGPYLAINNSIHNNSIIYRGAYNGTTGQGADYNAAALASSGNNVFDYDTYHVQNISNAYWIWQTGLAWSGFQQVRQETHGSVDNIMPPPQ